MSKTGALPFHFKMFLSATCLGNFCSEDGCGFWCWILKKLLCLVCSIYGWLRGKECCIVHRTKKNSSCVEWPAACEHHDSTNHLWHFVTLNRYFSEISVLVLYMALILIVFNCRTILLLAFLWVREPVSLLYSWHKAKRALDGFSNLGAGEVQEHRCRLVWDTFVSDHYSTHPTSKSLGCLIRQGLRSFFFACILKEVLFLNFLRSLSHVYTHLWAGCDWWGLSVLPLQKALNPF